MPVGAELVTSQDSISLREQNIERAKQKFLCSKDRFNERVMWLIEAVFAEFGQIDTPGEPPIAGYVYYTVSQQIPELRRVLESIDNDLVRYTQLLLAAIYQRILPPFCEVVRQLDADVMVCDEHSCPNALMFLALLDALKQSLDIVTAVADSDNRNKLSLVLTTAHGDLFREVLGLAKRNSRSAK